MNKKQSKVKSPSAPGTGKKKNLGGRPTVVTAECLQKLKQAFLLDCTDAEACLFAEISVQTLHNYQNAHPDFAEQKKQWKQNPFLRARIAIIQAFPKDPKLALEYMRNKKKQEFNTLQEVKSTAEVIETVKLNDNERKLLERVGKFAAEHKAANG